MVREKQLVISLHGIETPGTWQKAFGSELTQRDFAYHAADYGRFRVVKFAIPFFRSQKVIWFRDEYERETRGRTIQPSIVAHSFGTFLVAEALDLYPHISFDRIVLCGSIVRPNYDWAAKIRAGRCNAVHNDFGGLDFWAGIAQHFIAEAGESGLTGFTDEAVSQVQYPGFRHSDYFFRENYRKSWIPFLEGGKAHRLTDEDLRGDRAKSLIPRTLLKGAIGAVGCLAIVLWWFGFFSPAPPLPTSSISFEQLAREHRADAFPGMLKEYEDEYEGKQVTWDCEVVDMLGDDYVIAPIAPDVADFTIIAAADPDKPTGVLNKGARVKIKAIIDDINLSTVRLREIQRID